MFVWILFLVVLSTTAFSSALTPEQRKATDYFARFGYGSGVFSKHPSVQVDAITRFQYFANLDVTGELDEDTISKMDEHRCGIKDPNITVPASELGMVPSNLKMLIKPEALRRVRRYNAQGTFWKKSVLTWQLIKMTYYSDLTRDDVRRTMTTACNTWSYYTNIYCEETNNGKPDIEIRFETYRHNDPFPFDGPGGTLAHAFYPLSNKGLAGDMHLDDSETFTVGSPRGTNLAWVMTHELGHSLGLDHTPEQGAVMYPWYTGYRPKGIELAYDDILGIQHIYGGKIPGKGRPTTKPPTTATTTRATTKATTKATTTRRTTQRPTTTATTKPATTAKPRRKCPDLPIHGIYDLTRIGMSMFVSGNGDQLYFVKRHGIKYGPLRTKSYFPEYRLPGSIDAAFTMKTSTGSTISVIFSGSSYYIFRLFGYKSGPHGFYSNSRDNPLNIVLPNYVRKVDAAMRWHRNSKVYIFAGDSFWKYDEVAQTFFPNYPKKIEDSWFYVPRKIDAAYSSSAEKRTFFISGDQFYLLDDMIVEVAQGYPQHIGNVWLNCGNQPRSIVPPTNAGSSGRLPRPEP